MTATNRTRRTYGIIAIAAAMGATGAPAARAADPTLSDCIQANEAALKLRGQGKLRQARAQWLVCAGQTCDADVRSVCQRHVQDTNLAMPTIIFGAKDPDGADLSAVKVTMDGEVLVERLDGMALSIDPGEHTFTFEAAGQPAVTRKFLIQEAQKERREVIGFGAGPTLAPPLAASEVGSPASPAPPSPSPNTPEAPGLGTQKILALVAGGIGVVGVGLGAAFGAIAISKKSDAQGACPATCASQDGASKWADAGSAGNVSTVGFVVGGVALAGAAVLWFTAPSSSGGSGAAVGMGPAGLQLKGTW
jgi:hypothetical protein